MSEKDSVILANPKDTSSHISNVVILPEECETRHDLEENTQDISYNAHHTHAVIYDG